jgi:pimeloyl-ACP methyl ester carboxylesterase
MRFGWSPLLHDPAMRRRLHRIDKPTQLIWGAEDRVAPLDYARQLTAAIKGAQLHVITEAGHYVDVEKPDDTAQMISGRRKSGSILRGVA